MVAIPSRELSPGTLVAERYLVAQLLGRGGEGLVYAGVDTQAGAAVAIALGRPRPGHSVLGQGTFKAARPAIEKLALNDASFSYEMETSAALGFGFREWNVHDGEGVRLAIDRALKDSGVDASAVNYVNAHATSTPAGDMAELRVLQGMFCKNSEFKINSTKGMIGHLLGAASAVEAVACVKAIQCGEVHPNINLEDPEDDVEMGLLVGPVSEKLDVRVALSNSFGFGGHNSAVLFGKYEPVVE